MASLFLNGKSKGSHEKSDLVYNCFICRINFSQNLTKGHKLFKTPPHPFLISADKLKTFFSASLYS